MERDELLNRIRQERARLDEALSKLDDERLLESPDGRWSGKDQLAHLAAWQRVGLARITGGDENAVVGWTAEESQSKDLDDVNARIFELNHERPLDDVRLEFTASYEQLCDAIQSMNDDQLGRPWRPEDPGRGTYAEEIGWNTFDHYVEHIPAFHALAQE